MKSDRVDQTIHECLQRCYEATSVIQGVKTYLDNLRLEGWSEDAVQAVEQGVVKALFGVVEDVEKADLR